MTQFLNGLPDTPIVSFTLLILVILFIPPIFERLRLPGLVGLLVAGVVLGPSALQLLDPEADTIKLLSDIGKIYLMFVAGLEIDLAEFRKTKDRSLGFGIATFVVPLLVGAGVGRIFGFGWNGAFLIGSLLASHTLLGYPIVNRLGVLRNEAVTVTIGATIFTDIAALLVLAICVSIHGGDFSAASLALQLMALGLYAIAVLFGFDWAGKEYFRRTGDEESNQFLFVLGAVFIAALGAQIINVDKIVGAFLAGLAVNDVVGHGPVEEKVEFVGSTLFIPFFFVGMGLLLDVPAFIEAITTPVGLGLTVSIVVGLILSKFLAATIAKLLYRYNWYETLTMWSLSLPQVAATLAAALAGYEAVNSQGETLISEAVFNAVIVMMLITAVLGPVLTARYASHLTVPALSSDLPNHSDRPSSITLHSQPENFTVVVPIYNPFTTQYLIAMGALLAHHEGGTLVPLSIATAHVHMDDPQLNTELAKSQRLLERAAVASQGFDVTVKPTIRIDDDVAHAISRVAREQNASLVVMGWSEKMGLRARLFGNFIDQVFWSSHCPVAVMRLLDEPSNIRSILVPMKNITPPTLRTMQFAQVFAATNQAKITLLHVCTSGTPPSQILSFEEQLRDLVKHSELRVETQIKTIVRDDAADAIAQMSRSFDMVIMRSMRRRTAGGLAVSNITTEVIKQLRCSLVLFGEPHS
ncbi:MAG: cation:proton antiporter [Jaaginema sp. PMC 1079.18]|nr:cation:proton antiporter [Jaaginema sp. PMC 1080.18]MEC4850522.1 cation:proton antiporter [Jaaginema sp. PMC 1079.18]MEC4865778.1 cation:proton antiporter [Jaaginema sp. PMC 1078.18]